MGMGCFFFLNSEADLDDWTIIKYNRPEFP